MQTHSTRILKTFTGAGELRDQRGARRRVHYSLDVMDRRRWSGSNGSAPPRGHGTFWFDGELYVGNPVEGLALDAVVTLLLADGVSMDVSVERPIHPDLPWRFVAVGPVPTSLA